MKIILTILFALLLCPQSKSAVPVKSPVIGVWETERNVDHQKVAHIRIDSCQDNPANLCGFLIYLEEPNDPETGRPKIDRYNPDESKHEQPVLGMQMMWHYRPADETLTKYVKGKIYSATNGFIFSSHLELIDNDTLSVTGRILIFSQSQTWKRVKNKS